GIGPEMRVDRGEIGNPVTVIAGALLAPGSLHGLVLEHRSDPQGRRAQALDVVEPALQPLEVAAVVEALARRVEAGGQAVTRDAAAVVRPVAVLEPVWEDEIDDLVLR